MIIPTHMWKLRWDMFVLMWLMYVLVILPLEVAFFSFEENDRLGTICTLVFVADILICFRTGIPIGSSGMVELRPNVVAYSPLAPTS